MSKDAFAVVDMIVAVIVAHFVTMNAVVPARIVKCLCFRAIRTSLRLWRLIHRRLSADAARQQVGHANLLLRQRASKSIANAISPGILAPTMGPGTGLTGILLSYFLPFRAGLL